MEQCKLIGEERLVTIAALNGMQLSADQAIISLARLPAGGQHVLAQSAPGLVSPSPALAWAHSQAAGGQYVFVALDTLPDPSLPSGERLIGVLGAYPPAVRATFGESCEHLAVPDYRILYEPHDAPEGVTAGWWASMGPAGKAAVIAGGIGVVVLGAALLSRRRGRYVANPDDAERRLWVLNDEGLYNLQRASGQPIKVWIRENRALIDEVIDAVVSGRKRPHYLAYGR